MKFTVIFGSPRKKGNTAHMLEPMMDELKKNGAEIDYFDVYNMNIKGCIACLACQKDKTTINCIIQDDMQPILKSFETADVILFAAPVYLWTAPAPVKAVIDRACYSSCKYYGDDPHGPALMKGKKIALLTTCGYPVEKGADLFSEAMRRTSKHYGAEYAGCLAERHRNLKEAFMDAEKEEHARTFARQLLGIDE